MRQTERTQNPVALTGRVGSIPSSGTNLRATGETRIRCAEGKTGETGSGPLLLAVLVGLFVALVPAWLTWHATLAARVGALLEKVSRVPVGPFA